MDGQPVIEFQDGKDPGAFRTIGEVAKALGVRQHVLRYWEEQFPMLRPLTRAGGRRYYRPEDVALVAEIDRLVHREGYTLRGARQLLEGRRKRGPAAASPAAAMPAGEGELLFRSDAAAEDDGPREERAPAVTDVPASDHDDLIAAVRLLRGHLQAIRDNLAMAVAAAA